MNRLLWLAAAGVFALGAAAGGAVWLATRDASGPSRTGAPAPAGDPRARPAAAVPVAPAPSPSGVPGAPGQPVPSGGTLAPAAQLPGGWPAQGVAAPPRGEAGSDDAPPTPEPTRVSPEDLERLRVGAQGRSPPPVHPEQGR